MSEQFCLNSPVGPLRITISENKLTGIEFLKIKLESEPVSRLGKRVQKQLREYFAGKRKTFDIPLQFEGTKFQENVWDELSTIPYGQTISYRDLAERTGKGSAYRAVGNANGCNQIPIVIPCHRVIGQNGKLGGYSGGISIKKKLLQLEGNAFVK